MSEEKKFVLTETTKEFLEITLYQIKAVKDFGYVKSGELGGWIEKEANLSQEGNARVFGNAWVSGDALVFGNAWVSSSKDITWFSHVGSENGTLTAYIAKNDEVEITRGCFRGTLEEFERAVEEKHGDNRHGKEYQKLIEFIRLRFSEAKEANHD